MEIIHRLIYTAFGAATLFYLIVKISLSYWKKRGILHEKPKFLWGNISGVGSKQHIGNVLQTTYEKYKTSAPFIGFYALIKPYVLVLDLDLVEEILYSVSSAQFLERGLYNNVKNEPLSCNLVQLDGYDWHSLHEDMLPIFKNLEELLPGILKVADNFKRSLNTKQKNQKVFVINDLVDCYNVDIISAIAFGFTSGDTLQYPNTEFRKMTRNYMNSFNLLKTYLILEFPWIAKLLKYKTYDQIAAEYFIKIIAEKLKERNFQDDAKLQRNLDLLRIVAKENKFQRNLRNPEQLAAQAFTFILTGLEASNYTLTFALYELAMQPELQKSAREEIQNMLQRHNDQISATGLKELKFLKKILYETWRLHSPYPFLLRRTKGDYEIPGSVFVLADGNNVIIPTAAIHHDPLIYSTPKRFDPARFDANAVAARHPMAWLPFGYGPRGCAARKFVEQQMLVGLVTLLQHYEFKPCAETQIPLQYANSKLLHAPKEDILLRVEYVM